MGAFASAPLRSGLLAWPFLLSLRTGVDDDAAWAAAVSWV